MVFVKSKITEIYRMNSAKLKNSSTLKEWKYSWKSGNGERKMKGIGEELKKDKSRNNVLIIGLNLQLGRKKDFIVGNLGIETVIKLVEKIREKNCLVRITYLEDKIKILENK